MRSGRDCSRLSSTGSPDPFLIKLDPTGAIYRVKLWPSTPPAVTVPSSGALGKF